MALLIATASSGTLSAPAPGEQPGAADSAGSSVAGDAFAGVLAGVGNSGDPSRGQASAHDREDATADPAGSVEPSDRRPAELAGAELAMLALLAPALPASTVALFNSGCAAAAETAAAETAAAESGVAGVPPVGGAGARTGPAAHAAAPAQQAAAARPEQAVAAQVAAAAAKAARLADTGDVPGPQLPVPGPDAGTTPIAGMAPGSGTGSDSTTETGETGPVQETDPLHGTHPAGHGPVNALGPTKAADPAQAAASAAIFELARATQTPDPATDPTGAPTDPTGGPTGAHPLVLPTGTLPTGTLSTGTLPPGTLPPGMASPAIVTLPGTAAAIASTAGAAKPAEGETADAANPTDAAHRPGSTMAGSASSSYPGAHLLTRRPVRGPAAPGGQPAAAGDQVTAPVGTGLPAEPVTAPSPAGNSVVTPGDPSVQPAQAAQPVSAGQPAPSGAEPVHRHPAVELPLARQVSGPVLALRAGGDGSHQLVVALHPAELGPVSVHVRIEGDLMTIQLASNSETAHDALRDALPQLRSELQSAGLNSTSLSLDLTSGGAGAFANPRHGGGEPGRPAGTAPTADPAPRHRTSGGRVSTHSSAGLDRWL